MDLYGLTADDIEWLRQKLGVVENDSRDTLSRNTRRPLRSSTIAIGALTSAVAATTALLGKPKVGTLNVYSFSSTGIEDLDIDITVYSFAPQIATTDRWTVAERDAFTGKWILTTQYCS